jgi:SAM-dependent methyltransferase
MFISRKKKISEQSFLEVDFSASVDYRLIEELGASEYLIKVLEAVDKSYGLKGKVVADIGGSNITPQIARHYGIKKMVCIDPITKWFSGLQQDISKSTYADIPLLKNQDFLEAYNTLDYFILDECGEDLQSDCDNKFDIILSMSAFEHVNSITAVMDNIYNMLKPRGFMFSTYEPIFSCAKGHHIWVDDEINFTNVPELDFFHMLYSYEEAAAFLEKQERFFRCKDKILDIVYKSDVINRKTLNTHLTEIANSKFGKYKIVFWYLDKQPTEEEFKILSRKYGAQRFDVRGITVYAEK